MNQTQWVTSDAAGLCLKSGNSVILREDQRPSTPTRPLGGSFGKSSLSEESRRVPSSPFPERAKP